MHTQWVEEELNFFEGSMSLFSDSPPVLLVRLSLSTDNARAVVIIREYSTKKFISQIKIPVEELMTLFQKAEAIAKEALKTFIDNE